MATIKSFKGIVYNNCELLKVVAPPYDVINSAEQNSYYETHDKNIIRLILGREEDRYSEAKENFNNWQNDGTLTLTEEGIFPLVQTFKDYSGKEIKRKGFIAIVKIEEFEKKIILPHEKTLSKAKEDRLKLIRATNANFCQIFGLYSDEEKKIDEFISHDSKPMFSLNFQNVKNEIWKLTDKNKIEKISQIISNKQILIADGHHRYETALNYRNEMRANNPDFTGAEPYNYVMMFLTNLNDEGLVIFPTHRVIHSLQNFDLNNFLSNLGNNFTISEIESVSEIENKLKSKNEFAFGMICGEPVKNYLIELKDKNNLSELLDKNLPIEVKSLDVILLHNYILKELLYISDKAQEEKINIFYPQNILDCKQMIDQKKAQIAFIVNPTKIEQVRKIAGAGFVMPQKSTFFYPKLISGLILNKLN